MMQCPLCQSPETLAFFEDHTRTYLRCKNCNLTFAHHESYLSRAVERREYDLHENSPDDAAYRSFLNRLCGPLATRLAPNSIGLDFGCGSGPTLSVMLEELGHTVRLYDTYYELDKSVFDDRYDFITATEVIEHLHRPREELERLWWCLKSGGLLGIMTKLARDKSAFAQWHYKADLTHVCFFSRETFEWLARHWSAILEFVAADVVLFRKPSGRS